MFRRLSSSLPKDPKIPNDLTALGYFVNEDDQIRQIKHPDQKYQYQVNKNERVNEIHKEAMNSCIRTIVLDRLQKLDLEKIRLPLGASSSAHHTSILVTKNLKQKKRVIVVFGERHQDLGIFSYRVIGNDAINEGSAVNFVTAVGQVPGPGGTRGVIIANPGQLLWYRGEGRAITYNEWMSLPRTSAVHDALEMDPDRCTIPGNRDYREHVQYVFEHVMRDLVAEDVKFELIGLESTGHAMLTYLAEHWKDWADRIEGICLGSPQHSKKELDTEGSDGQVFTEFVSKRCRAYVVSSSNRETILTGREEYGCNCYASGERLYQENTIIAAWRSMLDWFNLIESRTSYEEVEIVARNGEEAADQISGHEADNLVAVED